MTRSGSSGSGSRGGDPEHGRALAARLARAAGRGRYRAATSDGAISPWAASGRSSPRGRLRQRWPDTRVTPNAMTLLAGAADAAGGGRGRDGGVVAGRPAGHRPDTRGRRLCSIRPTATWHVFRVLLRGSASGSTPRSTNWPTWRFTRRSPGPRSRHSATPAGCLLGMAYGMGKYLFFVSNQIWQDSANPSQKLNHLPNTSPDAKSPSVPRLVAHWVGHADIRWHLWIVLAACGLLRVELVVLRGLLPRCAAWAARFESGKEADMSTRPSADRLRPPDRPRRGSQPARGDRRPAVDGRDRGGGRSRQPRRHRDASPA